MIEHIKSLSVQNASLQQKTEPPELNSLKIQIHKIESEINTYMDKILLASESVMARINTKIEQLERECRSLKGKMEELKALSEQTDYSNLNLSDCVNAWSKYSIAERKAIAKVFIQSIVVSDEEIKVNLF